MILFIVSVKDACFITEVKKWQILNFSKCGEEESKGVKKKNKKKISLNQEAINFYQTDPQNTQNRQQGGNRRVSSHSRSPINGVNNVERAPDNERTSNESVQRQVVRVTSIPNFPTLTQGHNDYDMHKSSDNLLITPPSQKKNIFNENQQGQQSLGKNCENLKEGILQKVSSDLNMPGLRKNIGNTRSLPALNSRDLVALRKSYVEKVPKDFLLDDKEKEKTLEVILTVSKF